MTSVEALDRSVQLQEARLLLRYASRRLSRTQKIALNALAREEQLTRAAKRNGLSKQALQQSLPYAFHKLRIEFAKLGIFSSRDLIADCPE